MSSGREHAAAAHRLDLLLRQLGELLGLDDQRLLGQLALAKHLEDALRTDEGGKASAYPGWPWLGRYWVARVERPRRHARSAAMAAQKAQGWSHRIGAWTGAARADAGGPAKGRKQHACTGEGSRPLKRAGGGGGSGQGRGAQIGCSR